MATYLDGILAWHRARAEADDRDLAALEEAAHSTPPPRPFLERLVEVQASTASPAVIAEIKRRSPSRGDLAPALDPAQLAACYEAGGAACLSVLTDAPHFAGSASDLAAARSAVSLPALRKDFTVAPADVLDARIMGADAVLLIVAALDDAELARFVTLAESLSLAALVEVHDATEARRAEAAGARLVGVNQRDLRSFEVDRRRALDLAATLDPHVVLVAESGIRDAADVAALGEAGYRAVLVGETFVISPDPRAAVRSFATARAAV